MNDFETARVNEALSHLTTFRHRQDVPPDLSTLDSDLNSAIDALERAKYGTRNQSAENVQVVDSDDLTLDLPDPDRPLPERLAYLQRQLSHRDVVTTADVQAVQDEVQPVISGLADAMKPILDAFQDAAKDMVEAFQAAQVATADLESDDGDSDP